MTQTTTQIKIDDYILDTLLRDLTGHDHRPASFLIYLWLTGEQTRRKSPVTISYQELAENTGLSRSSAQAAVRWLIRRKLLSAAKANATAVPRYTVLFPWRARPSPSPNVPADPSQTSYTQPGPRSPTPS